MTSHIYHTLDIERSSEGSDEIFIYIPTKNKVSPGIWVKQVVNLFFCYIIINYNLLANSLVNATFLSNNPEIYSKKNSLIILKGWVL